MAFGKKLSRNILEGILSAGVLFTTVSSSSTDHPFFLLGNVSEEDKDSAPLSHREKEDDESTLVPSKAISMQNLHSEDDSPLGIWFRNTILSAFFEGNEEKHFFEQINQWQYNPAWLSGVEIVKAQNKAILDSYTDALCEKYPTEIRDFLKRNRDDLKEGLTRLHLISAGFHSQATEYVKLAQNRTGAFVATLEILGLDMLRTCKGSNESCVLTRIKPERELYLKQLLLKRPDFDQKETGGFEGALRDLTLEIVFPYANDLVELKKGFGELEGRLKRTMGMLQNQVFELKQRQESFLNSVEDWKKKDLSMKIKLDAGLITVEEWEDYFMKRAGVCIDFPYLFQDRHGSFPVFGFDRDLSSFYSQCLATTENYFVRLHQLHAHIFQAKTMISACLDRCEHLVKTIESEIKKEKMQNQALKSLLDPT